MLGWGFAIFLFLAGVSSENSMFMIAAGLFAIAGSLACNLDNINRTIKALEDILKKKF